MQFFDLNGDQRRELINTRQRFESWRAAVARTDRYRGSMVWATIKGRDYLVRSYYDRSGVRRQASLGPRTEATEKAKSDYETARDDSTSRLKHLREVLERQAAVNRALGVGRVPLIGARIIRALDAAGVLGAGFRVLGTNAIYAYEAAAGTWVEPELTTTEDIDLLFDSRRRVTFAASESQIGGSLLRILQRVDRSFQPSRQAFRAVNRDGYMVDVIEPIREPVSVKGERRIGTNSDDLVAVEIAGLVWHENAPPFEAVAIDERGAPVRMVTSDPRVWVAHKLWLSGREDREPIKRSRDGDQARAVSRLVADFLPHLPFQSDQWRMLPRAVAEAATKLFNAPEPDAADPA